MLKTSHNVYWCLPMDSWWEMTANIHFYKQELGNKCINNSIFVLFSITSAIAVLPCRQKWCQRVTGISGTGSAAGTRTVPQLTLTEQQLLPGLGGYTVP